jgi:hypothetical protein
MNNFYKQSMRLTMDTIQLRYIIEEDTFLDMFVVRDQKKEGVIVCWCKLRANAGLIAGVLNKAWKDIEDSDAACEMGG